MGKSVFLRRLLAAPLLAWGLGFVWFAAALPQPAPASPTDAIVVPTGSGGRIERGLAMLQADAAEQMLVTGVDTSVLPGEFAAQFAVPDETMACCISLGFAALDTRGNARETAAWLDQRGYRSVRLVTADWHMRRAALELAGQVPGDVRILRDAVPSQPSMGTLFAEYHKLMAAWMRQSLA